MNRSSSEKFLPEGNFKVAIKEVKARLEVELNLRSKEDAQKLEVKVTALATELAGKS